MTLLKKQQNILNEKLILAIKEKNLDEVKYLVSLGADVNTNQDGILPLIFACKRKQLEIANFLIDKGADVNCKEENTFETPLTYACKTSNSELVSNLLKHHANPNKNNVWRETPLIIACENGDNDIVEQLVEHGASLIKRRLDGKSALDLASPFTKSAIAKAQIKVKSLEKDARSK